MTDARTLVCNETFNQWLTETPVEVTANLVEMGFAAKVLLGRPDAEEGATLYWQDLMINEWAEHYPDLATAVARLAALIKAVESEQLFRDQPHGFTRWSEQFFERTVNGTIPSPQGGTL